jgi:hypothetical protein
MWQNNRLLSVGMAIGMALAANDALAKRAAPPDVPPVVHEGRRYEAPHFNNPCGQNGGCVVAYDNTTGAQLWYEKVYCTHYSSSLERDVQDVFIGSLTSQDGILVIIDEKRRHFTLEPVTHAVRSSDERGCGSAGCSYSSVPRGNRGAHVPWIVVGSVLVFRKRRARPKCSSSFSG